MRATGHSGRLNYSYQTAAILTGWSCEPVVGSKGHRFRISAKVKAAIEPWVSHRPLDLVLEFGSAKWLWRDVNPSLSNGSIDLELTHQPKIIKESKRNE
jgi:hypothetical protein